MKPKVLILAIVGVLILLVPTLYFIVWRPSDDSIQQALSSVGVLQKTAADTMPLAFQSLSTPIGINAEMTERFKQRVDTYLSALETLENSPAVQRNASTGAVYAEYKSSLQTYGQELQSLSTSIRVYGALLEECDRMAKALAGVTTKSGFDKQSAACSQEINDASASPNQAFNEQFFNDYIARAKKQLEAYEQYFVSVETNDPTKIEAALDAVNKAGQELLVPLLVTIDFGIDAPSDDVFTKLTQALNNQKNSFIR